MSFLKYPTALLITALPMLGFAQIEKQFNGVNLNESLATVQSKPKDIVASSKLITVKHTVFPLAKDQPEVLLLKQKIRLTYKKNYFKQ